MKPNSKSFGFSLRAGSTSLLMLCLCSAPMAFSARVIAQAAAQVPATNRFVGTITALGAGLLTVKTDAGVEHKVTAPDGIKIQRIAPGEKDLSKAAVIQFTDLAVGDRVLVRLAPEPTSDPVTAISLVVIPQADLAQKQQKDREEWSRNGVGGLVKSIDPGTGLIVITSGAGASQKTINLHTTPATVLRRYAADSVNFDQAKAAPIETIQMGDQLRARGTKNADGTDVAAAEVVSGSFRNISGTIASINASANTVTLKDLLTKQTVTVHVGSDAQMKKLPEDTARMLANLTKPAGGPGGGTDGASKPAGGGAPDSVPGSGAAANTPTSAPGGQQRPPTGAGVGDTPGFRPQGAGMGGGGSRPQGGGRQGGDLQQMLSRAPAIHLSDLQKGDAVMLVSTQGTSDVTAITLLAGVEPLLQAPASTQNMLLSNWNMGSGGAEAAQ
jgi:hypothetical protein